MRSRVLRPFLRWIVPAVVILLAAAGSGDSAGSGPTTSTGSQVTKSVPFARESIDEIRALAPFRSRAVPGNRAIPFHRVPGRSGSTGEAGLPSAEPALAAPSLASPPAPSAPAPDSSFAGLGNPPHTEGDVIPPDTMGAVGPNHLVSLMNSDFGVFDKTTGAVLQKIPLQSFWASLGTAAGEPADFPFDPKILYDQHSGRFVAVTLGGRSAPCSWVMIAVSPPSDPTGAWSKWAIDADRDNDVQQFNNHADFPGLGVDAFNVYVTANMFSPAGAGQYSKVWVIPKAQLLAGVEPHHVVRIPQSPGIRFHHATRPHLRDPRRGVHPLRGIYQPQPPGRGLDRQRLRHPGLALPAAGPGDPVCFDEFPFRAPRNSASTARSTRRIRAC